MKRIWKMFVQSCILAFALIAPVPPSWAAAPPQTAQPTLSLYRRLGGYDALSAVTDDFLGRISTDPQLSRFFQGHNTESLKRIRQHVVDFLCQATGGPCAYHGQDMKTAHTGLHITDADWDISVRDLTATLDKFKVPETEKGEVLSAIAGLKSDIVGR